MASSSVETTRLQSENVKLVYEKSQLYRELTESNERRVLDAGTISSLRQEIHRLNLV